MTISITICAQLVEVFEAKEISRSNREPIYIQDVVLDISSPDKRVEYSYQLKATLTGEATKFTEDDLGSFLILDGTIEITDRIPHLQASKVFPIAAPIALNRVNAVGRLGADPEVKYFESGSVLAEARIAVNKPRKNSSPSWLPLKMWGKTAEIAGEYVRKGGQIGVEGQFQFEFWSDRATGELRSKVFCQVDRIELLGSSRNAEEVA